MESAGKKRDAAAQEVRRRLAKAALDRDVAPHLEEIGQECKRRDTELVWRYGWDYVGDHHAYRQSNDRCIEFWLLEEERLGLACVRFSQTPPENCARLSKKIRRRSFAASLHDRASRGCPNLSRARLVGWRRRGALVAHTVLVADWSVALSHPAHADATKPR